jgi:type I restriction enzyme S subunit
MSEWRETTLGSLCERVITGGTPDTKIKAYYEGGTIPWVKTKEVDYRPIVTTGSHITQDGLNNSSAKMIPINSIIVAMYGQGDTAGRVAVNKIPVCTNQACCNLVIDESKADYRFIYYVLFGAYDELVALKSGSAQPNLNTSLIKGLQISTPDVNEQCAIAEVLSSLDDKIDLLTRQNATLEALAQTYFRQWFVESVSEDWETITLADLAIVSTGKGLKREQFIENGQYSVLGANGEIGRTDNYLYDEEIIITGRVGTHGKVFLINDKVWISDNVLIIKPFKCEYRFATYFMLKGLDYESMNVGSTQPLITQTDLKKQELAVTSGLFEKFNDKVAMFFDKITANAHQIQTLQKLRDTLLPKLISGEVRVK